MDEPNEGAPPALADTQPSTYRHIRDGRTVKPSADEVAIYEAHPNWERVD